MILLQSTTELIQTIVIVLFILSLINERITNFLKLNMESGVLRPLSALINGLNRLVYRRYLKIKSTVLLIFGVAERPDTFTPTATPQIGVWNLSRPEKDPDCEKLRERGILNLAILCGITVAVLSGADLFELIKNGQPRYYQGDGWRNWAGDIFKNHLLGCALTGLFISLGSKFWHDVLDLILYSSNLKRKLTQDAFTVQTTAELDEFVSLAPNALSKKAVETYGTRLQQQYPNVVQVSAGQRRVGNQVKEVVNIYLKDGNTQGLPLNLAVSLPSGRVLQVDTVVIPNVIALPQALAGSGSRIAKLDSVTSGTVCCLLFKPAEPDKRYALTCNHVLTGRKFDNPDGWIERPRTRVRLDGQLVGTWVFGQLDVFFDVALVELDPDASAAHMPPVALKPRPVPIGSEHFSQKKVTVLRHGGLAEEGFILALLDRQAIQYRNGPQTLRGVYELGSSTTLALSRTLTSEGDSGALVYDPATNEALAMIIAGNGQFSYALDLANVFQLFDDDYQLLAA